MARRLTKAERRAIVSEFIARNGGSYDPRKFVEEVRATGPSHPLYRWFEWDDEKAAEEFRVEQARNLVSELRIVVQVQTTTPPEPVRIRDTSVPFVFSPQGGRANGGGYVVTDVSNPAHRQELGEQAAKALEAWVARYAFLFAFAGVHPEVVDDVVSRMRTVGTEQRIAAE